MINQYINTLTTQATTAYTDKDYFNDFFPLNFGVHPAVYYEATMKINTVQDIHNLKMTAQMLQHQQFQTLKSQPLQLVIHV